MYFLRGPEEAVTTVLLLATPYLRTGDGDGSPLNVSRLRHGYRAYLKSLDGGSAQAGDEDGVRIVADAREALALARVFGLPETEGGDRGTMPAWKSALCSGGLVRLRALSRQLAQVFELVVTAVFSSPEGGGTGSMTTAEALGVVWVGPGRRWTCDDVAEAYLHELTHILLTLDEHRFGHYVDYPALAEEANVCISAIRRERRPLNAVIHSVVVAYELLRLRRLPGARAGRRLHEDSETIRRRGRAGYESIAALPRLGELCTPRMTDLLTDLGGALDREEALVDGPKAA